MTRRSARSLLAGETSNAHGAEEDPAGDVQELPLPRGRGRPRRVVNPVGQGQQNQDLPADNEAFEDIPEEDGRDPPPAPRDEPVPEGAAAAAPVSQEQFMATMATFTQTMGALAAGFTQLVQNMGQNNGQGEAPQAGAPGYVKLHEFIRVDPPEFSNAATEDPMLFVDEVKRICNALHCSEERSIELAGHQMKKAARVWFDSQIVGRVHTWEEFKLRFTQTFLPKNVLKAKAREFEMLKQGSMTVAEYWEKFQELKPYATHLLQEEDVMTERFVDGLDDRYYDVIASHNYRELHLAVNAAIGMENRRKPDRRTDAAEPSKKRSRPNEHTNYQGQYQGQRGNNGGGRFQHQQQGQRAPICNFCGNRHGGECWRMTGACLNCGQKDHQVKDCPNPRRNQNQSGQQVQRQAGNQGYYGNNQNGNGNGRGYGGRGNFGGRGFQGGRGNGQQGRGFYGQQGRGYQGQQGRGYQGYQHQQGRGYGGANNGNQQGNQGQNHRAVQPVGQVNNQNQNQGQNQNYARVFNLNNQQAQADNNVVQGTLSVRSEERRVGKECRSRWSPYH